MLGCTEIGKSPRGAQRGLPFHGGNAGARLFDIHAICQWCVASAVTMTVPTNIGVTYALRAPAPS